MAKIMPSHSSEETMGSSGGKPYSAVGEISCQCRVEGVQKVIVWKDFVALQPIWTSPGTRVTLGSLLDKTFTTSEVIDG